MLLVPAIQPGWVGLAMVTAGWTGLLVAAAVYNTAQNTYRQQVVPPDLRGRVFASWGWLVRLGQPVTPVLGGATATAMGLRPTLVLGAVFHRCSSTAPAAPRGTSSRHRPVASGFDSPNVALVVGIASRDLAGSGSGRKDRGRSNGSYSRPFAFKPAPANGS